MKPETLIPSKAIIVSVSRPLIAVCGWAKTQKGEEKNTRRSDFQEWNVVDGRANYARFASPSRVSYCRSDNMFIESARNSPVGQTGERASDEPLTRRLMPNREFHSHGQSLLFPPDCRQSFFESSKPASPPVREGSRRRNDRRWKADIHSRVEWFRILFGEKLVPSI